MQPVHLSSVDFDLDKTLRSIVGVRTQIDENALTASSLGTERAGHAVLIGDDGLLVTIGYLVTEAETVWIIDRDGHTLPGHVVGYDQETGFGLVQALGKLNADPIPLGNCDDLNVSAPVIVAGSGDPDEVIHASVIAKHEFAGYWEYLIDDAIFTAPAHPNWGGAALIGMDGHLYGVGSLILQTVDEEGDTQGANMIVPISLLKPILDELLRYGRRVDRPRPWLGWFVQESSDGLLVSGVVSGCPADQAGVEAGDMIVNINGAKVGSLPTLYREVWSMGQAGVSVPITMLRDETTFSVILESVDRNAQLKSANLH